MLLITPALLAILQQSPLVMIKYTDDLMEKIDCNDVLKNALIIKNGDIIDQRIIDFQNR